MNPGRAGAKVKGWKVCQRNRNRQQRQAELRGVKAGTVVMVVRAARDAKEVREAVPEAREGVRAASDSISGRRKSASFASRRWTSSTTSARTSCRSSCRSAARFFRAG
jgi:hypothetical protein